jgi:hypothetical protein
VAWATAHPYLAFLLGLTALNVIGFALSPPCAGWRALSPGCAPPESVGGNPPWPLFNIVLPAGNSVYHGLVRR